MTQSRAVAVRNADAEARRAVLNTAGTLIRIYSGSRPANADIAVGAQVLLSTFTLTASLFATASASGAFANTVAFPTSSAAVAGTATWFRCVSAGGLTQFDDDVFDAGNIGGNLSGLNMGAAGATVLSAGTLLNAAIGAFTYTAAP
jgi:hypothetical protein